jgi:tRNA-uridine 2-sulfurtransferase
VARPGPVVDLDGTIVGEHDGTADFTIGQRRGLGVAVGEPRYVVATDSSTATVTIGPRRALEAVDVRVSGVTFVAGREPDDGTAADVKVRYRSPAAPATLRRAGDDWAVRFDRPQLAIAPGQAAVFYDGDEVLGGGTIEEAA